MKTLRGFRNPDFSAFFALLAASALLAPGCGGDDNPEPSTPVVTDGTGGSGSSSGGRAGRGNGSSAEGGGANEAGSGDAGQSTGTGGKGSNSSGGRSGKGGTSSSGGSGGSGNSANLGGEGGGGEDIDCDERGPNGCYRCEPKAISPAPPFPHSESEQFLNHCDNAQGAPFDNFERIPGFTGTLPELP